MSPNNSNSMNTETFLQFVFIELTVGCVYYRYLLDSY